MNRCFFVFFLSLCSFGVWANQALPGRAENLDTYFVKIGECDLFFFMNREKDTMTRELVQSINNELLIRNFHSDEPSAAYAPVVIALEDPEIDPKGAKTLENYTKKSKDILENQFGFDLKGISTELNLYYNAESLVFHHDRFVQQYNWLSKVTPPVERYTLLQDLAVFDWQMSKGTVTGTVVQDGDYGDRYLMVVYPKEVIGTIYTEPAVYLGPDVAPSYPGHVTIPYHTGVPPIDLSGEKSCGCSKGKRLSSSVRGLVKTEQMDTVRKKAKQLFLNKKHKQSDGIWKYDNGIIVKALPNGPLDQPMLTWVQFGGKEKENTTVLEIPLSTVFDQAQQIGKTHNIESMNNVKVYRLVKKDSGFSKFKALGLDIAPESRIILVNNSIIPEGYRYFHLAQDFTEENLPWIQMYHFHPATTMEIPSKVFSKLSLTPTDDLLYMDETKEIENYLVEYDKFNTKIQTVVDVYIFEK